MPQKVTCVECEHTLYKGNILKSPQDIIKKYDGNCPKCNRKLKANLKGLRIYPNPEEYPHLYDENGNLIESKTDGYRGRHMRNRRE